MGYSYDFLKVIYIVIPSEPELSVSEQLKVLIPATRERPYNYIVFDYKEDPSSPDVSKRLI